MRWVFLVLAFWVNEGRAQVIWNKDIGGWVIRDENDLETIEYWGRKNKVCDSVMVGLRKELEVLKRIGRVRDSLSIELQGRVQESRELLGGLGSDLQASKKEEERLRKDIKRLEGELNRCGRRRIWEGLAIGAFVGMAVFLIKK